MYIKLDNARAFPVSGNMGTEYDYIFRVMSETNVSNMWKSVIDKESFVVSYQEHLNADGKKDGYALEFFINGHFFSAILTKSDITSIINGVDNADSIFATILMGNAPTTESMKKELKIQKEYYEYLVVGTDTSISTGEKQFTGIQFTTKGDEEFTNVYPNGTANTNCILVPEAYYSEDTDAEGETFYTYYVKPYSIRLLKKVTDENGDILYWDVPKESWVKYNSKSLCTLTLDGGIVT